MNTPSGQQRPDSKNGGSLGRNLYVGATVVAAVLGALLGDKIDYSVQRELMSNLQSVGAVVFGIIGAWVAIIFPHAQKEVDGVGSSDRVATAKSYHRLLTPLVISCILFLVLLICMPVFAVLEQYCNAKVVCRVSFCIVSAATVVQMGAVFMSLGPVVDTRRLVSATARKQSVVDSSMQETQSEKPRSME